MKKDDKEFRLQPTLCIECSKACNRGCSWSDEGIPVDGWTAEETRLGYLILECPEFIRDGPDRGRPAAFDTIGIMNLMEGVLRRAREDYTTGDGLYTSGTGNPGKWAHKKTHTVENPKAANRKAIEKFFRSKYAQVFFEIENPEQIIQALRQMARQYETKKMIK